MILFHNNDIIVILFVYFHWKKRVNVNAEEDMCFHMIPFHNDIIIILFVYFHWKKKTRVNCFCTSLVPI